ncbi:MAG: flagellar basal body rod protein FlgC [Deltaproteobacteria bacterium]|nr:flagellar basal body rod protein FlgC [Deltaproteobacteria bacterium]
MNFLDALQTSSSGLTAQRTRMNVISSNLANINTTRTPEGGPYKRKDVVFAASPLHQSFQDTLRRQIRGALSKVDVIGIVDDKRPPQLKYDPQHPDANEKGYVAMPNVNLIEEMVNMISATRSYEAGVTALNATKDMALKALEIGR